MPSQNKGFIDRKAFSVLSPKRGKHVIGSGQSRGVCYNHRLTGSEPQRKS